MALRDVLRGPGRGARRVAAWALGIVLGLALLLFVASFFVDRPLRGWVERRMNQQLKGYKVSVPRVHFSLLRFSLSVYGLVIRQEENPEPPVAQIGLFKASVHWRELLSAHLVADVLVDHPRLHIDLPQLQAEVKRPVKMKDEGWQRAIEAVYPLKMNLFRVRDGDVVYIDKDPKRPLHLSQLEIRATNIRNIHSRDRTYPSPVKVSALVFDKGRFSAEGHADFLAEPFAGFHVNYAAREIPVAAVDPAANRANLKITGGELSSSGEIEWGPRIERVRVAELAIAGLKADFIHEAATATKEKQHVEAVKEGAKEASNKPGLVLDLAKLVITKSQLGFVNRARDPGYRVFADVDELLVTNLSNHEEHGTAHAKLTGRFLGSGATTVTAAFRPVAKSPDFEAKVAIEDTDMRRMNDLLRSYGKFDVTAGSFSFYMELRVANRHVEGSIKPLFREMKVYDARQDAEKSAFRKLYEKIVGGIANLLENRPRKEVATEARISGPAGNAKTSTWEVIGKLVENAFFHAILPGFDEELARLGKGGGKRK